MSNTHALKQAQLLNRLYFCYGNKILMHYNKRWSLASVSKPPTDKSAAFELLGEKKHSCFCIIDIVAKRNVFFPLKSQENYNV